MKNKHAPVDIQKMLDSLGISKNELVNLYPNITKPLVKISDLNISSREYYYWSEKKIVNTEEKQEWIKLNLIQVIWVKIVDALRSFSFPVNEIVNIKDIMHYNIFSKEAEYSDEVINLFDKTITDTTTLKLAKEMLFNIINNREQISEEHKILGTTLGAIVSDILLYGQKVTVLVYKEGEKFMIAIEGLRFQSAVQETITKAKRSPHFSIYINELIEEFIDNKKTQKFVDEFGLLKPEEKEIVKALRDGEVREIQIKKDQDDDLSITTTSRGRVSDEDVRLITKILSMNTYDDIRLVLRNKKHIYLENKTKKKITTR